MILKQFLNAKRERGFDPDLLELVQTIADATIKISRQLRVAVLHGHVGATEDTNVQGEVQKPLDVIADNVFVAACQTSAAVSFAVSEEQDNEIPVSATGKYAVIFDPLDGSSNLDVNVTVGSIVSVIPAKASSELLQPGRNQVFAAYAAYGPSTSLVLTFGDDVDFFSLNADEEYELADADVKIPSGNAEFSINTSRQNLWDKPVQDYIAASLAGEGVYAKRYNMRWVGSMVADIHRIMHRGGIFLYPNDAEIAKKGGRLRLLYEANPMGFLVEAAGGGASTGLVRILDIQPKELHQRVPVILGALDEVEAVERRYAEAKA